MLRRLAALLFVGGFGVIPVHANSIALMDTRLADYRATKRSTQLLETRPIFALAWVPRSNLRQRGSPDYIHFCGRPCSATTEFRIRFLGIAEPGSGQFIAARPGRNAGIDGWFLQFLRHQFGRRVSRKMCREAGAC
jgi:hypothetical protein